MATAKKTNRVLLEKIEKMMHRIEQTATVDDQEVILRETFDILHGEKPLRIHGGSQELTDWFAIFNPFFYMLHAKAYESAAFYLLPADTEMKLDSAGWYAVVGRMAGHGPCASLALTCANLRNRRLEILSAEHKD